MNISKMAKKRFMNYLFQEIHNFWQNFRKFSYYNRTIFEILFIFIYALEQAGLIWFTYNNPENLPFIVSIFAIIVLTTFSLHKILMESRIKLLEENLHDSLFDKKKIEANYEEIIENQKGTIDALSDYLEEEHRYNVTSKSLNNKKQNNIKKRSK